MELYARVRRAVQVEGMREREAARQHPVLCAIERRPPRLGLENYPHLPVAEVSLTQASDYQALLSEVAR